MYLFISFAVIFFTLGYLIRYQKRYNLMAGYNNLSKEQKKKVDMKKASRMIGNLCFFFAVITFMLAFYINKLTIIIYIILIYGAILYTLMQRPKFDRRYDNANRVMVPEIVIMGITFIIVMALILIGS